MPPHLRKKRKDKSKRVKLLRRPRLKIQRYLLRFRKSCFWINLPKINRFWGRKATSEMTRTRLASNHRYPMIWIRLFPLWSKIKTLKMRRIFKTTLMISKSRTKLRRKRNSIKKRRGKESRRKRDCKSKRTLTKKTRSSWTNSWNWYTDMIIKWVRLTRIICSKSRIEKLSSILFKPS